MKKQHKKHHSNNIPKLILYTGKILSLLSSKLVTDFAIKLFTTPLRHKMPKRELEMETKSRQKLLLIPAIDKKVVVYEYGQSSKKILLVHGWSGRGTQLAGIAHELLKLNYMTISFDAPAHGKSPGQTTLMLEFIATIMELEKQYGPFEAAIGHSLGGMSLLNAVRQGLRLNHLVTIGSGDIIKDIMNDFAAKLKLKPEVSDWMESHFNQKYNHTMNSFSAYLAAKEIDIPVLVIHDRNDEEVPVNCGIHIYQNLKSGQLMLTEGLGHRKIIGNPSVIERIIEFIKS